MRESKFVPVLRIIFIYVFTSPSNAAVTSKRNAEINSNDSPTIDTNTFKIPGGSCNILCPVSGASELNVLKYLDNEPHKYKVEGSTFIHSPSSLKGEGTQLHYIANIDLTAENRCSFILRVINVKISGIGINEKSSPTLSLYPIRFSWTDGQLDKLCLDPRETETDANFKRSIISNLQISPWGSVYTKSVPTEGSTYYETDVHGRCAVTMNSLQEQDGTWLIRKHKDLNKCKYRQGYDLAIKTGSYNAYSGDSINPFVKAALNSVIRIEKNMIKSVSVEEEYVFQPLSNYAESISRVTTSVKMNHIGSGKTPPVLNTPNMVSASLLFDNVKNKEEKILVPTIIKAVHDASQEIDGVVPITGASNFGKLVNILQRAPKETLLTSYAQIKSGAGVQSQEKALTAFWDGLIYAASPNTVETGATLMENGELPESKIPEFLASLSFVKYPTDKTLSTISNLLEGENITPDRYLAVGSLIRRYISNNAEKEAEGLLKVVNKLATPLSSAAKTIEEENKVISSLKGLRNAQFVTPEISELVRNYAANKTLPNRIRVAALQTMMENSIDEKNTQVALQILQDVDEDSELRIQSFLLYTKSPSSEKAETIKRLLDNVKSDQVGSYITSFIRNLRRSTSPEKELLRQHFSNIKSKNRYPFDLRQYSQNSEFSQFFPILNLGYSGEGNVIYSTQSYIPRSTSLNLDISLFGNTLNLFELDGRFENIEYLLEKLLGPRSYINTKSAEDIADDFSNAAKNYFDDVAKKASVLIRSKRDLRKIKDKLAKTKTRSSTSDKYLDIDLGLRVFESEVYWQAYHVDKDNIASGQYLDRLFLQLREAIEAAKNMNVDYKRHYRSPTISNSVVYYPTSTGFPIKITTDVLSVVSFKLSANVDVLQMVKSPQNTDMKFSLIPSANVQVDAQLEIDASIVSVGLKATSSLHTATGMNIELDLLEGRGFDLKFGVPVKEQDIITMETKAFVTVQEQGQPQIEQFLKPSGERYEYTKSFDQFVRITGISFQADISSPSYKYIPTFCPGRFSIRMKNEDADLKYYEAKFEYKNKDDIYKSLELSFDTPGSSVDRKTAILAEANEAENTYLLQFNAWKKHLSARATGISKENELLYNVKLMNDNDVYNVKVGATITREGMITTYKPFIDYSAPLTVRDLTLNQARLEKRLGTKFIDLDGSIVVETDGSRPNYEKYNVQMLTILTPLGKTSIDGFVLKDRDIPEYSTDLKTSYGDGKQMIIKTGYKVLDKQQNNESKEQELSAQVFFKSTQWPLYNFNYQLSQVRKPRELTRNMSLTHGPDLDSALMTISSNENYNWDYKPNSNQLRSFTATIGATYPLWKMSANGFVKQENNNLYEVASELKMNKTKMKLNSSVNLPIDKPGNVNFKLESQLNNRSLNLDAVREIIGEDKSRVTIDAKTVPKKQILAVIDVTHRLKKHDTLITASSVIKILPNNNEYKYDFALINLPNKKGIHVSAYPNSEKSFELKAGYTNEPNKINGSGSLFVKNNVNASVKFKRDKTKAEGELNVNMTRLNRLVTGKLDVDITNGRTYKGYTEMLWDAGRDNSQRLRIDTDTTIANDGINITTNNDVRFVNYAFKANGNMAISDEFSKKQVVCDVNFVLPENSAFGGKIKHSRDYVNTVMSGDLILDAYYTKNKKHITTNYILQARNIDIFAPTFDIDSSFTLVSTTTEGLRLDIAARRNLADNLWSNWGKIVLNGSFIPKSFGIEGGINYPNRGVYSNMHTGRSLLSRSASLMGNLGDNYAGSLSGSVKGNVLDAKLKFKVPVENKPFTFEWNTTAALDVVPSKSINMSTNNNARWNEANFIDFAGKFDIFPKNGKIYFDWTSTGISKRSVDVIYSYDAGREEGLKGPYGQAKIKLTAGKKSANCNIVTELSRDLLIKTISLTGNTPVSGNFDIRATSKIQDNGRVWFNNLALDSNSKKYYMLTNVNIQPTQPEIELQFTSPEGESKLSLKFQELKSNHWNGYADIVWQHYGQGYIKADGEIKIDAVDDILVKAKCDSPILGINNFSIVARNEVSENGKKLNFKMNTQNGLEYSGVIPYTYRKDKYKIQVEGAGTVKVGNENVPISFKISRSLLTETKHGENGNSNHLHVNYDKKYVVDVEGKFTDKAFSVKRDLRVGDKLYKMHLVYNGKVTDASNYGKTFLIHIDLRPHIPNGESFEVIAKTTRSPTSYDEHLTIQWSPIKKLEYNSYSTSGKSGFNLNLPQRQIAGEAVHSYKLESTSGDLSMTATLWFDKTRDMNQKAMLSFGTEYKVPESEHSLTVKSLAAVQIPTLPKSLTISTGILLSPFDEKTVDIRGKLDMFKTEASAIDVSYQIIKEEKDQGYAISDMMKVSSAGQGMNIEFFRSHILCYDHLEYHVGLSYLDFNGVNRVSAGKFDIRLTSISSRIRILDDITLNGTSQVSFGRNYIQFMNEIDVMGHEYGNTIKATTEPRILIEWEWKGAAGALKQKAQADINFVYDKFLGVNLQLVDQGPVALFTLYLDEEKFMKSDTELFIDKADILMDNAVRDLNNLTEKGKNAVNKAVEEIGKHLEKQKERYRAATFDMEPIIKSSNEYMTTLKEELQKDLEDSPNIKNVVDKIVEYAFAIMQQMFSMFGDWMNSFNIFLKNLDQYFSKLAEEIKNQFQSTSNNNVAVVLRELMNRTSNMIKELMTYVQQNQAKWKAVYSSLHDSVRDTVKIVYNIVDKIAGGTKDIVEKIMEFVRSLPITSSLKEKLEQMKDSEFIRYLWSVISEQAGILNDSLPIPEVKTLNDMLISFVDKLVKNEPFDMKTDARNIAKQILEVLRSLYSIAHDSSYIRDLSNNLPHFSLVSLKAIPSFWSTSISTLSSVGDLDMSYLNQILETYGIGLVNPLNLVPPFKKIGVIVNGNQVVTMNGNYFTVSSDGQYLLAAESVNNTFTIASDIQNGKMVQFVVSSSSQIMELFSSSNPLFNGKETDYPIYGEGMYAIKTPNTIEVYVDNSVKMTISPQLDLILVQVSGFYYNKVQGLLGSVNSDSYMDFMTPDNKIARDVPDFVKSYQVKGSPVAEITPVQSTNAAECAEMFNGKSVLRRGFSFVKEKAYREMCEQMVTLQSTPEGRQKAACKVGQAFSSVSHQYGFYLRLPSFCSKCIINETTLPYGNTVSVRTPGRSADIILILEKTKANEVLYKQFLFKTLKTIRNLLKTQKISDIDFLLVGYGPEDVVPSLHTTNGKLSLNNKTKLLFTESKKPEPSSQLGKFVRSMRYILGAYDARQALQIANEYPFRPGTVKAIIHLKSSNDDLKSLDQYDLYNSLMNTLSFWNIVNNKVPLFLISPIESFTSAAEKGSVDVFGFDFNNMYTVDGPKPFNDSVLDKLKYLQRYKATALLPLSTGGAAFNSSMFSESDSNTRSQLADVLAKAVIASFNSGERYLDCVCGYNSGIYSEVKCSLVTAAMAA